MRPAWATEPVCKERELTREKPRGRKGGKQAEWELGWTGLGSDGIQSLDRNDEAQLTARRCEHRSPLGSFVSIRKQEVGRYELRGQRPACLVSGALLGQQSWQACRSSRPTAFCATTQPRWGGAMHKCPPPGTALQLLSSPRLGPSKWLA